MRDWLEWAIITFIVLAIAYVVWKGGAANPESTGALGQKVNGLSGTVSRLDGRVKHVEQELEELKQEAATTKDIGRLEAQLKGANDLAERTYKSIDRIERFLIEKGLGGK